MLNKQNNVKIKKWVIVVFAVIAIAFNVLLTWLFSQVETTSYLYILIPFGLIINVFYIMMVKDFFFFTSKRRKNTIDSKLHLLDKIDTLKPISDELVDLNSNGLSSEIEQDSLSSLNSSDGDLLDEEGNIVENFKLPRLLKRPINHRKTIQLSQYCDRLRSYLLDNGLKIDKKSIREVFSSMAATRMIILKSPSVKMTRLFVDLFTDFIGSKHTYEVASNQWRSYKDLRSNGGGFNPFIEAAYENKALINFMTFSKTNLTRLDKYLSEIMDFSVDPALSNYLNENNKLPNNIWFFIIPSDINESITSRKLLESSFTIDLDIKIIEPKEVVEQNDMILTYQNFTEQLSEAYETQYLEEDQWKKLDQIESYVNNHIDFKLDNRVFRQLERYTSTYILCGGEISESMDSILASKILPSMEPLNITKTEEDDQGFLTLFEDLFGLENLVKSKEQIKHLEDKFHSNNEG